MKGRRSRATGRRGLGLAVLLGLAGGGLLLPPPAAADDGANAGSIVAVVPRHWPPQYTVVEGAPAGFAIDVMDAVAERAGLRVAYRVEERWPEALDVLRRAEAHVVPNLGESPERRAFADFTSPVEALAISLFVRAETLDVEGLEGLAGRPVAVVEGSAGAALLHGRDDREVVRVPSVQEGLFALLSGSADGLVYAAPVVRALLHDAGLEGRLRVAGRPLAEVKRAIAVRHGEPELLARLDAALRSFQATDAFRDVYVRWHTPPPPFWSAERVAWAAGGALALGLLGMAVWRYRSLLRLHRSLRGEMDRRARVERALREEQSRLHSVKESLAEGLVVTDPDGGVVDVNRRALEILGYERDEMVGRPGLEFFTDAEERATIAARLEARRRGYAERYEARLLHRDGSVVHVEVYGAPLYDADGRVIGGLAAFSDLTERKQTEEALREREEELRHAQRMEAVGRLAGGVAHDFNNLLTAILGHADALLELARSEEEGEPAEQIQLAAEQIQLAAEQAAGLTARLLAVGRRQLFVPEVLDLDAVVEEVRELLRRAIAEDVRLEVQCEAAGAPVRADRGQLSQVVLNLALNARDAMPGGGRLALRTREMEIDAAAAARHADAQPGPYVVLEIADTGSGIEADDLPHIFDPFFTTKEAGKGTGLGLATVYAIVKQSGGYIEVESARRQGTTFRVFLPRAEGDVAASATSSASPANVRTPGGRETVLVVEDEDAVRSLVGRSLRDAGYFVFEAASGDEALSTVRGLPPHQPDLLVTDVVMPGLHGDELVRRLKDERGPLPVLFLSGYAAQPRVEELLRSGARLLQKPFHAQELRRRVREALDAGPAGLVEAKARPAPKGSAATEALSPAGGTPGPRR